MYYSLSFKQFFIAGYNYIQYNYIWVACEKQRQYTIWCSRSSWCSDYVKWKNLELSYLVVMWCMALWLGGRKGIRPVISIGGCGCGGIVSLDGVAPTRIASASASIITSGSTKIQKNDGVQQYWFWVNSLQCTSCQKWVHKKCSGIKGSMSKVAKSFICRGCLNLVTSAGHTSVDIGASAKLELVDKFCYLGGHVECGWRRWCSCGGQN